MTMTTIDPEEPYSESAGGSLSLEFAEELAFAHAVACARLQANRRWKRRLAALGVPVLLAGGYLTSNLLDSARITAELSATEQAQRTEVESLRAQLSERESEIRELEAARGRQDRELADRRRLAWIAFTERTAEVCAELGGLAFQHVAGEPVSAPLPCGPDRDETARAALQRALLHGDMDKDLQRRVRDFARLESKTLHEQLRRDGGEADDWTRRAIVTITQLELIAQMLDTDSFEPSGQLLAKAQEILSACAPKSTETPFTPRECAALKLARG